MTELPRKLSKALRLLADRRFRRGLLKGVAATVEHQAALEPYGFKTVIDVGAHRGQFTLLAAGLFPDARILAFEPLADPFRKLLDVTSSLPNVRCINLAIGAERASLPMNVAERDHSSSLLPITETQERVFPKTGHQRIDLVETAPLDDLLDVSACLRPALLKIDVQGFELEVLKSASNLLSQIDVVYVEASFVELYRDQPLADDVIVALRRLGFRLITVNNLVHSPGGQAVQADFLFERMSDAVMGHENDQAVLS